MTSNSEKNTKGGLSPTRASGRTSTSSQRDVSTTEEDTVMNALLHNARHRRQHLPAGDEATPSLLSGYIPQASGYSDVSSSLVDTPTMRIVTRARQGSTSPSQGDSRSETSREILLDILTEAIEIGAEYNLGRVNRTTAGRQQGPSQHQQQ